MTKAAEALRYLAENPRPAGGQSHYNSEHLYQLADEVEAMRNTMADIVASIEDYERVNNLAPAPGRMSRWDCVATAKTMITV